MQFDPLGRKVHHWTTALLALPVVVAICAALLLQRAQPAEPHGTGTTPAISLETLLRVVQMEHPVVAGWDDVQRIDFRPSRGLASVWLRDGWEVQVDLGTGRVLRSAHPRSRHWSRLAIFLVAGSVLAAIWILLKRRQHA